MSRVKKRLAAITSWVLILAVLLTVTPDYRAKASAAQPNPCIAIGDQITYLFWRTRDSFSPVRRYNKDSGHHLMKAYTTRGFPAKRGRSHATANDKAYKEMNLRTKLLLLFMVLILFPLSLQGVVTYRHFSSTVDQKTEQFTVDIVRQINANLDRLLKDFERLSMMPLYDQAVLTILSKYDGEMGSGAWASSDDYMKMKLYTSANAYDRSEIRGIHLISNSGIFFSNVDSMAVDSVWDSRRDEWFAEVEQSGGLGC